MTTRTYERLRRLEGRMQLATPPPAHAKHLLIVEGDVEPRLAGPYKNDAARLRAARRHRRINADCDGIFKLDVVGSASVSTFSGGDLS